MEFSCCRRASWALGPFSNWSCRLRICKMILKKQQKQKDLSNSAATLQLQLNSKPNWNEGETTTTGKPNKRNDIEQLFKATDLCIKCLRLSHMILVTGLHAGLQSNHFLLSLAQLGTQPRLHIGHLGFLSSQLLCTEML